MFKWKAEENWPVEYVSPNVSQFGYRARDLMEGVIQYADLVLPEDLPRVAAEVGQYSQSHVESFEQEYRILRADGSIRWIYDFTRVVRDGQDRITHYHGYILDVTERKRTEEALRESSAKYEAMVEGFDGLVYICSPDYIVEFANRKTIERTGYNPVGQFCYKALHARETPCPWCVNEPISRGKTVRWEVQSPKDHRWYYVVNTPLLRADGRRSKMAMIQDITERKLTEDQLHRRDSILQAVTYASEQFLKSPSWQTSIQEVLSRLGKAAQASRVYMFQQHALSNGDSAYSLRYEWTESGVPSQLYNSHWQDVVLSRQGLGRWETALKRGEIIKGHVRDLPESERAMLQAGDTRSILIVPIITGASQWGFIGFDQIAQEREWSPVESDSLKTAADIMASAFHRIAAEEELMKLTGALNQTADSIVITNKAGQIEYVNPAFETLTGYSKSEAVGKTPHLLNSGHHAPQFFQNLWQTILAGQVFRTEFVNRRKDGTLYYQAETITPIRDHQGRITHFISTGRDVTERRQSEEDLRRSRELLQLVLDSIPQFVFWKDIHSVFLGCNRNFARIAGVESPENIKGKTDYELAWSKEQAEGYREWDRQVMQSDKAEYHIIERQHQADGKQACLDTNKIPLHDAEGRVVGILGTFEDITERQLAEQNIQRLAAFPQLNPNPVLEFHEDGSLSYFNQAAQEMTNNLGQTGVQTILPAHTPDIVRECLSTGHIIRGLEVCINHRTISWTFFPVPAGRVVHGYGVDSTERLNLESQLRQLQKMDAVGRLAGGVAHDFNNILTAILGYTSVLLLDKDMESEVVENVKEIARAAERAASLTKQLLTFSRRQVMQTRELQMNKVIHNMTQMLKRIIGEDINLDFNYGPDLPCIHADEVMMEQVILNLAVNARDAMPHGGQLFIDTSAVEISAGYAKTNPEARPGQFVCLSVMDTGCGMDEKTRSNIFEPFFSTKEPGKGTGLGLATVYGIVKQHEGWIEAQSSPGKGALFKVYLPAVPSEKPPETRKAPQLKVQGGHETVLIVEDEEAVRQLMRSTLKRYGYRVLEAVSGMEALALWEKEITGIELLLTDMVMPGGVTGRDLADKLQASKKDLKVLYTSGYNLESLGSSALLQKAFKFLPKPFSPETLARSVRECLDS